MDIILANWPAITAAFGIGLVTSLHCIGMCGPLAMVGCRSQFAVTRKYGAVIFTLAKLISYSALGLLAGYLGSVFLHQQTFGKTVSWVSIVGGSLMIAVIIFLRFSTSATGKLAKISGAISKFAIKSGRGAPFFLGIAAAFLPCGPLYAMVVKSATEPHPLVSMAVMQAFGIGTMPALIGVGTIIRIIPQRWKKFGNIVAEVALVLTGLIMIWRGIAGLSAGGEGANCCSPY
ncbi:sulfite exporter TauE/SafE family protein [bacterium]|nr:sulfite exporter TauE/SafE family protein [bacterium]RQV94528.1 MAG: sulfite exporter TauE/SafE family protein [bacterium]